MSDSWRPCTDAALRSHRGPVPTNLIAMGCYIVTMPPTMYRCNCSSSMAGGTPAALWRTIKYSGQVFCALTSLRGGAARRMQACRSSPKVVALECLHTAENYSSTTTKKQCTQRLLVQYRHVEYCIALLVIYELLVIEYWYCTVAIAIRKTIQIFCKHASL